MKYYIKERLGLREIGRDEYYKLRRRKNSRETIMFNGGIKTGRYLTFRD